MTALPIDQAATLRKLVSQQGAAAEAAAAPHEPARGAGCVIAVASGKGGVGKTNIAVNLAIALARSDRRTILVDADLGTANVDVVFNVHAPYNLSHVLEGRCNIDEIAVDLLPGLRLIPGASGLAAVADCDWHQRQALVEQLTRLETQADTLVIDCGAGISQNVLAFAAAAEELLIITTPEPTALTDAYALAKVLTRLDSGPSINLVVNQARSHREARLVAERLSGVAARFLGICLESSGHILRDPHVPAAVHRRTPFILRYPRCSASSCITALANRLAIRPDAPAARPGFFRRAVGFFC